MLNSFSNNKNNELSKKIEVFIQEIKDKLIFDLFDDYSVVEKEKTKIFSKNEEYQLMKIVEKKLNEENKLDSSIKNDIHFEVELNQNSLLHEKKLHFYPIKKDLILNLFQDIFKEGIFEIFNKIKKIEIRESVDLSILKLAKEKIYMRKFICLKILKIFEKIVKLSLNLDNRSQ